MRIQVTIDTPSVLHRPRRIVAALAIALALVVPGVALAAHLFADVPDSNPFHANITNLANSGVTAGCGGSNFCPSTTVTREQMAAFLNRGLGRATVADLGDDAISNTSGAVFSSFSITPGIPGGAVAGAAQVVQVTATFTIRLTDATGCPCTFRANVKIGGAYGNKRVADISVDTAGERASHSITGAALVGGSAPVLVEVELYRIGGTGTASAYGNATAATYAFAGNGTNTFGAGAAGSTGGKGDTGTP